MNDDLERFVSAQDSSGSYDTAMEELRGGLKKSHWMWYVFPQVAGLGRSAMSQRYAIDGVAEAAAYLAHPVLGPRLLRSARLLTELPTDDPAEVLGTVDAQKLQSCMTLFEAAASDEPVFGRVLEKYFGGVRDQGTLRRL
ncbi:MAG TPA: DUF1810 domain-containing protein [Nocardioidaceae bacterium]|nr:DUF1810 domain-containing protein [Nocardioidaceae bacterium]